ncbi:4-hydroxythreonine-4-phosphate dehydrogenase PdxA [Acidipropionibacterium jensenii]|uniref:4-hydroxythreonine-4-phosphate dehydrogenase PdxA n=1 Tax=Acidipropionibacterium jensenii TaxID=1749 RepID=UPI002648D8F1|nr:4-hydroxythreonine-4-phosphate dehydrogenase PdxA [Acidipropionibacterium jensenii]MDN5996954.1 4-hydroxythreonine-4-phosphate dehydrogenase PdxA [Acidipropionibacterium jensenii]
MSTIPRIAMTIGDPSGVGPEIAVKILSKPENRDKALVSLLASPEEVESLAAEFKVSVPLSDVAKQGYVQAIGTTYDGPAAKRGVASIAGGTRAMLDLERALELFKQDQADAILFESLNKSALHNAGMHEQDELRWFARILGYDGFTSELNFIPGLTTSRVTSHVAIKDVAAGINARSVHDAITLLTRVIQGTGIERPKLAVCALNPHAGESGQFGREEIDHIAPGIRLAQDEGVDAKGPFPCDTIFIKARAGEYDGVVTMFHDQGQIAMKLIGFDEGVTVQGGLPVPIATPAHGTAYEIVGQGIANDTPSQRAFDIATGLGRQTQEARVAAGNEQE